LLLLKAFDGYHGFDFARLNVLTLSFIYNAEAYGWFLKIWLLING